MARHRFRRLGRVLGRLALVGALAVLASGCFVLDELDAGSKEMDRYSGKPAKAKQAPAKAAAPGSHTASTPAADALSKWWQGAHSLGPDGADPSIVRCRVGGAVQFEREDDCRARGGQPVDG